MQVEFDNRSPEILYANGYGLPLTNATSFRAPFAIEKPCIVQGRISTDHVFKMGAFSASYGGRLRCIEIGRYCSFSGGIDTGWDEHPIDWASTSMMGYVADVHGWASLTGHSEVRPSLTFNSMRGVTKVGHDVWIGQGVFLQAGVSIGTGAVIGARALVTKNVPPYAIVGGVPARVIRYRFPEGVISDLLELKWWEYSMYDLPMHLLNNVPAFITETRDQIASSKIVKYSPSWTTPADLAELIAFKRE